ncbi:hypothetical protein OF83DRAFT_1180523 [Amylostereum chailletii]|nr:hypothetical protein OF83DRAFT_1180523 [Amylostereum chailletii]
MGADTTVFEIRNPWYIIESTFRLLDPNAPGEYFLSGLPKSRPRITMLDIRVKRNQRRLHEMIHFSPIFLSMYHSPALCLLLCSVIASSLFKTPSLSPPL